MPRRGCAAALMLSVAVGCFEPGAEPGAESGAEPGAELQGRDSADRPNVIFVFFDQFRADVIGAYGGGSNISTPNIDRLAREGTLFTNGLSTTPLCSPYRGMLMTGRYPTHSGILLNFLESPPHAQGIAEVFRDGGYRTAFMGKWHLAAGSHKQAWVGTKGGSYKDAEPFIAANPDFNFVPPGAARLGFVDWAAYNFHADFAAAPYYRDTQEQQVMDGFETDALTTMAIDYMEEARQAGDPFFLMLAPHPPHPPFYLRPEGSLKDVSRRVHWNANVPHQFRSGRYRISALNYHALCKNADDNVGRILDYLDRSGLGDDTILVVTSDHGEMLGSHGRRNKMVPYAEAIRVPVVLRWPGRIAANRRSDTLQTPMDHFPTLAALAGLEVPADLDGVDLSSELLGGAAKPRAAVLLSNYSAHWDYFMTAGDRGAHWPEWRGVKTQQYTYVRWLNGEIELYDDGLDPAQLKDLSGDAGHAPLVAELEAKLVELLAEAHDEFLSGSEYVAWVDAERNIVRTGLGTLPRSRASQLPER